MFAFQALLGLRSLDAAAKQARMEALVVNAWFSAQAGNPLPGGLARVEALQAHPSFDIENPNKVRSLFVAFATGNVRNFHAEDGSGYRWAADRVVALDALNPQVSSRLAKVLTEWPRFDAARGRRMRAALAAIGGRDLSMDVREVVDKGLQTAADR